MIESLLFFILGCFVGKIVSSFGKEPTFLDVDLMAKYNVEFPELQRMKKNGLV